MKPNSNARMRTYSTLNWTVAVASAPVVPTNTETMGSAKKYATTPARSITAAPTDAAR